MCVKYTDGGTQNPPSQKGGANMYAQRIRAFALITYVNEERIKEELKKHDIVAWAYIKHDKDETEEHYHVIIQTQEGHTTNSVRKWFKDEQNTLAQPLKDVQGIKDYLTHQNEPNKHHYEIDEVQKSKGAWDIFKVETQSNEEEIINSLIKGEEIRNLVKRYGKEFIYHYNQYKEIAYAIKYQEEQLRKIKEIKQFIEHINEDGEII